MALITCPECKKQVSSLAPACPHCGLPHPAGHGKAARDDKALLARLLAGKQTLLEMRARFLKRFPDRPTKGYKELNAFLDSLLSWAQELERKAGNVRGMIAQGKPLTPGGYDSYERELCGFLRAAEVGELTYRNFTPKYTLIDPTQKKNWL